MNAVAKVETRQELAQQQPEPATLMAVISRAASDPNTDIEKMERLMGMYERMELRKAEAAFNEAMVEAQAKIGRIGADKQNSQTHSWYATYAAIDREVRPIYTECGFALSFNTESASPETVRVVCLVSHRDGFTRSYGVDMPADGKGAKGNDVMTKTHAAGSAMSYGQRYLLKLIFNIAIGVDPDDDDGNGGSAVDQSWFDAIASAVDTAGLHKIKADMLNTWKEATKVPTALTKAYNERLNALKAAK